ncbi:MAG TPA: hypothetical protein VGC41_24495 [Kofleriaceae bacterium]
MKLLALALLVACHEPPKPIVRGSPEDLAEYLRGLAGTDEATRTHAVATWLMGETAWSRDLVEPYRGLYAEYTALFSARVPALVDQLRTPGEITARRHFAGDPRLEKDQARLRWSVPVQFPSAVAELAGKPIDAVFIHDGTSWRALLGLDAIVMAHVEKLDHECALLLAHAGPPGKCTEVGWLVADAALRAQPERFAHACALASTLCGNPAP